MRSRLKRGPGGLPVMMPRVYYASWKLQSSAKECPGENSHPRHNVWQATGESIRKVENLAGLKRGTLEHVRRIRRSQSSEENTDIAFETGTA